MAAGANQTTNFPMLHMSSDGSNTWSAVNNTPLEQEALIGLEVLARITVNKR